jgi:hypothetical protein
MFDEVLEITSFKSWSCFTPGRYNTENCLHLCCDQWFFIITTRLVLRFRMKETASRYGKQQWLTIHCISSRTQPVRNVPPARVLFTVNVTSGENSEQWCVEWKVVDWNNLAQVRDKSQVLVNAVLNNRVTYNAENIFNTWPTISCSRTHFHRDQFVSG